MLNIYTPSSWGIDNKCVTRSHSAIRVRIALARASATRDIIFGYPCIISHEKVHVITKRYDAVYVEVHIYIVFI